MVIIGAGPNNNDQTWTALSSRRLHRPGHLLGQWLGCALSVCPPYWTGGKPERSSRCDTVVSLDGRNATSYSLQILQYS